MVSIPLLGARLRTPRRTQRSGPLTLRQLRPGIPGRIVGFDDAIDTRTARRLHDLGFVPDRPVAVLRRAPLGDPLIVQVGESEVALRAAQCSAIHVRSAS